MDIEASLLDHERQFWLGLKVALVIAVSPPILQVGLDKGFSIRLGVVWAGAIGLGLLFLSLLRAVVQRKHVVAWKGLSRRKTLLAVLAIIVLLFGCSAWLVTKQLIARYAGRSAAPVAAQTPPKIGSVYSAEELSGRLTKSEWALDGDDCGADGIRFRRDRKILIALIKDAEPIEYVLDFAKGDELVATRAGRMVTFEIHDNGFFHTDRGYTRWYRVCPREAS